MLKPTGKTITRKSLLENLRIHNEAKSKEQDTVFNELLELLNNATMLGKNKINVTQGKYYLLDSQSEAFKTRFESMGLFYTTEVGHSFQCDCDAEAPCTKWHVISVVDPNTQ